jgi:hypothetical protein
VSRGILVDFEHNLRNGFKNQFTIHHLLGFKSGDWLLQPNLDPKSLSLAFSKHIYTNLGGQLVNKHHMYILL